ncbi:hypothetical protein ACFSYH_04975 [Populibacterium corticicola]|uniref:Intracellular proteinase inhibitor BsuPI domain-containing protein n=1 Tax=Populibacterium corticicola TaxID=1812826 RepID=A0ABW5XE56_9MICO
MNGPHESDREPRTPSHDRDPGQPRASRRAPAPTPQYVYWIRRAVALLIVVALIAVIVFAVKFVVGLFRTDDTETADDGQTNSSQVDSEEPKGDDGASPKACDGTAISIALTSERNSVDAGAAMPLSLDVTNESDTPCVVDVSPATTVVTIYSGSDRIWSSDDCDDSGTKPLYMDPKAKTSAALSWNGIRSNESCDSDLPSVRPGTYRAVAKYKEAESKELVFQLK